VESLRAMMLLSVALCAVSTVGGLLLAYGLSQSIGISAPPGPLIILLAAFFYTLSAAARAATQRRPVAVTPATP
jgi:ABC-type Mn2+/Zn2+ transport system permease subunit